MYLKPSKIFKINTTIQIQTEYGLRKLLQNNPENKPEKEILSKLNIIA